MKRYNPIEIEPKWQQIWADDDRYKAVDLADTPKYYVTGMFPYPSGAGMHAGHFMEHSIVDGVARFRRALGYNVLYPMGWDSFGLPAENYAIKTGKTPQETTATNIANFKNQLTRVGASIDWSREVNTADPEYYKWTQWIFTQLYARDLAYQKEAMQWWCPKDKTVLANEQVVNGRCWRCDSIVVKKPMKQWFFKITDYADELLGEIPALDWPEKIKTAQTNWIGRSEGAEIEFEVDGRDDTITVFSTRPDTLFGATFLVIAPEHPLARRLVNDNTRELVENYIDTAIKRSEIERSAEGKEKTGVFTGSHAINPANGEKIPIWVADYVLWGYGTGAVMGVPGHDERDFAFAEKFELPIIEVIEPETGTPQENPEYRSSIVALVRNPVDDTYLSINWGEKGGNLFIGGGLDEGETAEEAARREITEETGYQNVRFVEATGVIHHNYFAHSKNVARRIDAVGLLFELMDDIQVATQLEDNEKNQFSTEWLPVGEIKAKVKDDLHALCFELLSEKSLYHGEGILVNSGQFDGMSSSEAREEIVAWLEQQGRGRAKVTYKMRDWLISRQRYWGAPIPIIHCPEHGAVAVPEKDLPVVLPAIKDFAPRGDGKTALAADEEWVNTVCPTCGGPATRETDTMDGYACSSWYLLRYTDAHDKGEAWQPQLANYWAPLDMYVGGDHAVAHLLYVRFWTHVFKDMGLVDFKEPVKKLVYHGLIQAEDGRKMSKSLGNVVDPLEVIDAGYGADALRVFELFLGPINEDSSWSSRGIAGVYRFLNRVWTLTQEYIESDKTESSDSEKSKTLHSLTHATIKKVTEDYYRLSFNTAIAAQMELVNELYKLKLDGFSGDWQFTIESLVKLIQPLAPHMAAELWQQLGHETKLDFEAWPEWDEAKIISDTLTIIVQVNGKLRSKLEVSADTSEDEIKKLALADENVQRHVSGEPKKVIYVKNKLVSIVA